MSMQYFKSAPLEAHLTVIAKVNLDGVRFLKKEDRNTDTLTVISAIFDRNGNFIKGIQRVLDMKLRDETLEKLLDQGGISVRSNLDLPPGSYLVRLVVRDAEGKAMAMRERQCGDPLLMRFPAILLLTSLAAHAQVTRTEAQSVLVDVLVTDKKGAYVPGLTTKDFGFKRTAKSRSLTASLPKKAPIRPSIPSCCCSTTRR